MKTTPEKVRVHGWMSEAGSGAGYGVCGEDGGTTSHVHVGPSVGPIVPSPLKEPCSDPFRG